MKARMAKTAFKRVTALFIGCCLGLGSSVYPEEMIIFNTLKISATEYQAIFYVSPEGDDSGDGSYDLPFRTLERARDEVRKINGDMSGDICVYLRGGTYCLTEPVVFDTRDSGTNGHRIIYTAYESEIPVINGASQVTGWTQYNEKIYKASLDRDYKLRNLYVNDKRASMTSKTVSAQGGFGEYSVTAGQADWAWDSGKKSDGASYKSDDIPKISSNKDDLEIVNGTTWNENIVCSRDVIDINGSTVILFQQPYGAIAQTPGWNAGFSTSGTHTIYNAFEFMDEPGEFYFDKTEKILYYYPREGEDMRFADVEAPTAERLIVIDGESVQNRVKNLSFSGITFENTDYQLTEVAGSHGKATCQASNSYIAFADSNWHSKKYEMDDTLPAMIDITNSESISFTGNIIKHSGSDGLSMTNDVVDSYVTGNYINDITASGITIGHPQHIYIGDGTAQNHEKYAPGIEGICKNNVVSSNMLYDISVVHGFGGCAAITAYYVEGLKITHNQINRTAYNGIHLGWGWCEFLDSDTCRDNEICYNRVTDCLNRLHDSGGIYTIGQMPGTIINENYVERIPAAAPYQPTYGLHNDEGTAYIEENDNVLEISPDVTYTINCEDFGKKHHLTILRTYASICKMGINPPDSQIEDPIVVSDNVWPFEQYKICLASGLQDEYKSLIPEYLLSDADYVFPAACQTKCSSVLPIRNLGTKEKIIWIAPDGTKIFAAGSSITKASGSSSAIKTPLNDGEYRIYVTDRSGNILSESSKILRVTGSATQVDADTYTDNFGVQTENCSEGGKDVAYIDNGDYVGYAAADFGNGASSINLRVASGSSGGTISVRLDGPEGELIGTCKVENTDGWQTWKTQTCEITPTSGKHALYFVFSGGEGSLLNVRWWKINTEVLPVVYGDADRSGCINIIDMIMLKNSVLEGNLSEECDLDGSCTVDSDDVFVMQDYLFGKTEKLPIE